MSNLALTYSNRGQWEEEAEKLQLQVLETHKTMLGPEHPHTLTSMANLSLTWKAMEQQMKALQLMDECIQLRKRVLGANHGPSPFSFFLCDVERVAIGFPS